MEASTTPSPSGSLCEAGRDKPSGTQNENKLTVRWQKLHCSRWLSQPSGLSRKHKAALSLASIRKWDLAQNQSLRSSLPGVQRWQWTGRFPRQRRSRLAGGRRSGRFLGVALGEPAPASTVEAAQPAGLAQRLLVHLGHRDTKGTISHSQKKQLNVLQTSIKPEAKSTTQHPS